MRQWNFIVRGITLLLAGAAARADVLYLNDGRVFEGVVVRSVDGSASIDTMIGTIRTTLVFGRREVSRIEEKELPEGYFGSNGEAARGADGPDSEARLSSNASIYHYIEAPLVGAFGTEVLPLALAETLKFAAQRGIGYVVLRIDSPGGDDWASDAIALALQEYSDRIIYFALVERARAAAIRVAFACDEIFVAPVSQIGGAVEFSGEKYEVDGPSEPTLNAAYTAVLGTMTSPAHRLLVADAMTDPLKELYSWIGPDGDRQFSASPLPGLAVDAIDAHLSVLTCTGQEMLRLGLAHGSASRSFDIGAAAGIEGWKEYSDFGQKTAQKYADRSRALRRQIAALETSLRTSAAFLERHAPKLEFAHDKRNMSETEIARWRRNIDDCLDACRRLTSGTTELGAALHKAEDLGLQNEYIDLRRLIEEWRDEAQRRIPELQNLRNRTTKPK